ncbi:L-ribulose-5-phosphate 4-epimerase UlaF [Planctomycetes bacterium CA13]|uniref:L-ribulose-5-phosphate 4-epimerase n=1 Tax=Novipirellula herctigrandis TaxID=2527986 RepID=A0A5C5ZA64_9BACT|nr:L-ribulose-5-phosphate 4-epimerase UlaF [Planctomycetes bacterium CA13]
MLEELKEQVFEANIELVNQGLVTLTWGNVSGIDRERNLVVIKPSGVAYTEMESSQMVVVDFDGKLVEGDYQPSTDTPTHVRLYKHFPVIGGITHTHSSHAVMFAQARREIPCYGTTHADHFYGPVPLTRPLSEQEVTQSYEASTADAIIERFADLDAAALPAVLVAGHGPFAWGPTPAKSVENAVALEAVAQMAMGTMQINVNSPDLESYVLEKHFKRKHGPAAYYGQK